MQRGFLMKYALIGDLHSNVEDTISVLKHIDSLDEPLQIIGLGDLFECKISKKKAAKQPFLALEDTIEISDDFIKLLRFPSIIGNQELRIMQSTGQNIFRQLPEKIQIDGAILIHGHQFTWTNNITPKHKKMEQPLVFFGHSHHSALFHKGVQLPIEFSKEIILTKKNYSINVGSVIYHREWCLFDAEKRSIIFMKV